MTGSEAAEAGGLTEWDTFIFQKHLRNSQSGKGKKLPVYKLVEFTSLPISFSASSIHKSKISYLVLTKPNWP